MSRQVRYRVTAIVLGGFFLGVPMLTNGTAGAKQLGTGGRQVTFEGGGILTFSCRSRPDAGAMTVPAGSTVRVVNRTGHHAKLRLGGVIRGSLRDATATDVVFRRGTTSVGLEPDCAHGDDATPVQVTAAMPMPVSVPVTMSSPLPVPLDLPTLPVPASGPHRPGGGPQRPGGEPQRPGGEPQRPGGEPQRPGGLEMPTTAMPGPVRPDVVRPHPTKPVAHPPAKHRPHATRSPATRWHTKAGAPHATVRSGRTRHHVTTRPKIKVKAPTGTAGARVGGRAGGGGLLGSEPGVPGLDLAPTAAGPPADAQPASRLASSQSAAAEPVAAMRPLPVENRVGLLGVIAAVCAVGVTIAAIRSIVSQRANRPIVA